MNDDARPTLVFFSSTRSGPARRMESLIAHFARKDRERLRVVTVDVDDRRDLAERLSVECVPALVLLANRRPIARIDGRASAPRITAMLEQHLERGADVSASAGRSPRA
jgi:thioredoxin-like negative regulator of GroEL